MVLTVVASGSAGNCYVLQGKDSALIIECGVSPEVVMRAIPKLDWSKIAGVLVSHEHGDHAGFMTRYMKLGLNVYASLGTIEAKDAVKESRAQMLLQMHPRMVGDFLVKPFKVLHDAAEPLGFIVEHREMGKLLFVTDTRYIPFVFKTQELDHILVEANYDDGIIDDRVESGEFDMRQAIRVRSSHHSLRSACEFLRANETGNLKTVTLIHLSSQNSDPEKFRKMAEDAVLFASVHIAKAGMTMELRKEEFSI